MNVQPVQPNLASFDKTSKIALLGNGQSGPCFTLGSALSLRKRIVQIGLFADDYSAVQISARLLFNLNQSTQQQINLNLTFPTTDRTSFPTVRVTKEASPSLLNNFGLSPEFSENLDTFIVPYADGTGSSFVYLVNCSPFRFNCDFNQIQLCVDQCLLTADGTHNGIAAACFSMLSTTP